MIIIRGGFVVRTDPSAASTGWQVPMPETVPSATESDAVRELVVRHCSLAPDPSADRLAEALDHHWSARGKQVRAHIALSCAGALGLDRLVAETLAASIECLHNASLIQDDLQDRT